MHVPLPGWRSIAPLLLMLALGLASEAWGQKAPSEAERLLWQGNVNAALQAAQVEAEARPDDLDAQELLIDIYLAGGRPDRAVQRQTVRVQQAPADPDARYLLGRALVDPDKSREAYEQALRFAPDHGRSHMGIAAIHMAQGRLEAARDAYRRAARFEPTLGEAWLGWIRAAAALGDRQEAVEASSQGLKALPGEGGLYLARMALVPAQALPILEEGVRRVPADPRLHEALSTARLEAGEIEGALQASERALKVDPSLAEAARTRMFARAIAAGHLDLEGYQELGRARGVQPVDPDAAMATFEALVRRYPDTALTWLARAQLRQLAGDRDGALADLASALKRDPENTEGQAAYGLLLLEVGRAEEARPWLQRAASARPWDGSLRLALGRTHREAGDPQAAVLELTALRARYPGDAEVVLQLAQAQVEAGDPEKAYYTVRDALKELADPRLGTAMILTATAAGRFAEAASMLDQLAEQTGDSRLRQAAADLRRAQRERQ